MVHLKDNGIPCATVLPSVNGKNYEFVEMVNGIRLPLRCFTLLPGKMMQDVGYSNELYFKVGQLMAKFHNLTTNYSDDKWFRVHRVPITLECWDYLENEFKIQLQLGLIKPENAPICEKIFRDFNSIVIQNRHQFEEGGYQKQALYTVSICFRNHPLRF
jgi:Ser/Thr protein kinase RdoA (MazF antagonist)